MRPVLLACTFALAALMVAGPRHAGRAAGEPFAPAVSVQVSDETPGGHPDLTVTIDVPAGPLPDRVQLLTPPGGDVSPDSAQQMGVVVGWVSGYTTIGIGGAPCTQRFPFTSDLVRRPADTSTFPAYLQRLAPGSHRARFEADVAGTLVEVVVDDVRIGGEPRLKTTTYIGDPAHPPPNCAPFRSRISISGATGTMPLLTAPPTPGPRAYDITLTARDGQIAQRSGVASVAGLHPRLDAGILRWDPVPGAATYRAYGSVTYTTTCPLIRRLVIRQQNRDVRAEVGAGVTSLPLPASPGPDWELAQTSISLQAGDAEGVLLARSGQSYTRDFASCWYPPGTGPLLSVEPAAGPCDGQVTFRGSRFPPDLSVAITAAAYATDGGGLRVARAPVAADGSFALQASLPADVCGVAAGYPGGRMHFFAYNADEPPGMTAFASTTYAATLKPGRPGSTAPPDTGSGPPAPRVTGWWWLLAVGGTLCLAAGLAARRVSSARSAPRRR